MKADDSFRLFLLVIVLFIAFLFKPQVSNWWARRKRIKELEEERKLNAELIRTSQDRQKDRQ